MAAKVEIIYEAEATSLKATVNEVNKANDELVKGAQESSKEIQNAYKGAINNATKVLQGDFLKKAVAGQVTIIQSLGKAGAALKPLANSLDETSKKLKIVVQSEDDVKKLEDRLRKLSLEGKRNTEEFQTIAQAVGEYKSAIIAADRAVDLYAKQTDAATGRIGELEDKLYDLALAGQTNSQEFKDLVKEVAVFKRAIVETDAQVDALTQRGARFTGFVQSVELVGNAFQAVEGAAALFGEENEELQKTLVRLQAIMAITSAIEQGRVIITEQLAAKTGIAAVATKLYAAATAGATAATVALRVAIAATGVGLLITGIALLVDRLKDAAANQAAFNRSLELSKQAAEGSRKAIQELQNLQLDSATRIKIATGQITQAEADRQQVLKETQKTVQDNINIEIGAQTKSVLEQKRLSKELAESRQADARAAARTGEVVASAETKRLQTQIATTESNIKASQDRVIALRIQQNTAIAGINKAFASEEQAQRDADAKKAAEERAKQAKADAEAIAKAQKETFRNLLNETAALQKEFDKKQAEERKNNEAKLQTELTDLADTSLQTQLDTRLAFLRTLEIEEGSSLDRRINIIELEGQKRQDAIRNSVDDQVLANKLILEDQAKTQAAIREEQKKTRDEAVDYAFQIASEIGNSLSAIVDLQNQFSQNRIESIQEQSDKELEAINKSLESEVVKENKREALQKRTQAKIVAEQQKQARREKALNIFKATIDTAASIVKTGAQLGYPAALPFQILAGIIGAANIAAIAAQPLPKFKRGGLVGGQSHEAGGTVIEAERGEFVVNKTSAGRHRSELDALNRSSAAFRKLIDERYVRPAIFSYANKRKDGIVVNASLNSKSMEKELKGLRKDMRKQGATININGLDSRYSWQRN